MTNQKELLGRNLRRARERIGMTQAELAEVISQRSSETISQIEKGRRDVKAWELYRMAKSLNVEMQELLSQTGPVYGPAPLWRSEAVDSREKVETLLRLRSRRYRQVLDLTCQEAETEILLHDDFDLVNADYQQARALAERVRAEIGLGDVPGMELTDTLEERCNIMIFYQDLGEDGSAVSVRGPFGSAMLLNAREAPWRRIFSCAHELFHLLTWDALARHYLEDDKALLSHVERLADAFASSLLLPTESLHVQTKERIVDGRIALASIISMARYFQVSTSALVWRLVNMGVLPQRAAGSVLSDPGFRAQDRRTMHAHWWTPSDLPKRYVERAFLAFVMGKLSRARLAEMLEQDLANLSEFLASYDLDIDHLEADFEAEIAFA